MRALRRLTALAAVAGAVTTAAFGIAAPALAHPMGNFSVNQYAALTFAPHEVRVAAVVNTAEIPTRQDRVLVDTDHDNRITVAERGTYTRAVCQELATDFHVDVGGRRLAWRNTPGELTYSPGAAGLTTARLSCTLVATAGLDRPAEVTVVNLFRADRLGWQELTAVGDGLQLVDSPLPTLSPSNGLRSFPATESVTSLSQVRTATLRVVPAGASGRSPGTAAAPSSAPAGSASVPARPTAGRSIAGQSLAGLARRTQARFERLAGGPLSPVVVAAAVLLALLLGAGHAVLPGHGKTVFAAYLAGRDGRPRDAIAIGAAVTVSHTGSVLVVGALISTGTAFAAERVLGYLALLGGLAVLAVGCGMTFAAVRRSRTAWPARHPGPRHLHDQEHGRRDEPGHGNDGHHHAGPARPSGWGMAGIGIGGGLVPSPSALIVLLAAVGLGRAVFGVLLVVAYGIGMAVTLTVAGLMLLLIRRRLAVGANRWSPAGVVGRLARLGATLSGLLPALTAAIVVVVGAGLVLRAAVLL